MRILNQTIFLLTFAVFSLNAQNEVQGQRFGASVSLATAINDPANWFFHLGPRDVLVRLGFSGSIAATYGPFPLIGGSHLTLSPEIGFSRVQTSEVEFGRGTAQAIWKRTTALLWIRFETVADLSPYVQLGLGTMNSMFEERHSSNPEYDISLDYWTLGWGAGAGIRYRISELVSFSLFGDHLAGEGTRTQNRRDGSRGGIYRRTVVGVVGIRTTIIL